MGASLGLQGRGVATGGKGEQHGQQARKLILFKNMVEKAKRVITSSRKVEGSNREALHPQVPTQIPATQAKKSDMLLRGGAWRWLEALNLIALGVFDALLRRQLVPPARSQSCCKAIPVD